MSISNYTDGKAYLIANWQTAIQLAKNFYNSDFSREKQVLTEIFNDIEFISRNSGELAVILASSKFWAFTDAAQNTEVLSLDSSIISNLCTSSHLWGLTPAAQNVEVLKLFNGLAAIRLSTEKDADSELERHNWGSTKAAQNIEVLKLGRGKVALNLSRNSQRWLNTNAVLNPEVITLSDWEVGVKLSNSRAWCNEQCTPELLTALLHVNTPTEQSAAKKQDFIAQALTNNPSLISHKTLYDYIVKNRDKNLASMLLSDFVNVSANSFANSSLSFSSKIVSLAGYQNHNMAAFEGVQNAECLNPLYNAIMIKGVNNLPARIKDESDIKRKVAHIMRQCIAGCAHDIPLHVIRDMLLPELDVINDLFNLAVSHFQNANDKEGELLTTVSASLFYNHASLTVAFCNHFEGVFTEQANKLMDEFSPEELTFVNDLECGAIAEVVAKNVIARISTPIELLGDTYNDTMNFY